MIFLLKIFSKLPFRALYLIADMLSWLMYRAGYRKNVVFSNLQNAFPNKKPAEIRKIARDFYRNLADTFVETIKSISISEQELRKRVKPVNMEFADRYFDENLSVVAMVSHTCNWEWVGLGCSTYFRAEPLAIYQQLKNQAVDDMMKKVRSKFGAKLLEKKFAFRNVIRHKDVVTVIGVIADQSPKRGEHKYWTTFLGQPSAFFTGGEKMARMFNFPAVYVILKRVGRGYYEMHFEHISEPPYDTLPENAILEAFARKLERDIHDIPANWLWSHKRWKLKPSEE